MKDSGREKTAWLFFVASVGLWFLCLAPYLTGRFAMTRHGVDYYFIIRHFMDNLMQGIFPLWEPFGYWGRPDDIDQRFIGEYNPFLWFYGLFAALGVPRPVAFLLYCFVYYQVGILGFLLLARRFLKDSWLAVAAAVALMFSSLTFPIFDNYCINLIVVPVIWFFYFVLAFAQQPQRRFFLGMIFALAVIAITYMPFYFVTVMIPFVVGMLLLFAKETWEFLASLLRFMRAHKMFCGLCVGFLILALIPGLIWYLDSGRGDMILNWRHENAGDDHTASMSLQIIQSSSAREFMSWRVLFPGREYYLQHIVFFVSCFLPVILLLSVVNRIRRRQVLLLLMAVWLFLIALADVSPLHGFLYRHLYMYRLFRNLIYFVYFIIPVLILFSFDQLRIFLRPAESLCGRWGRVLLVWIAHAVIAVALRSWPGVFPSTPWIWAGSLVFFSCVAAGGWKPTSALTGLTLAALVLLQPVQVLSSYPADFQRLEPWHVTEPFAARFQWQRPLRPDENYFKGKNAGGMQDFSGFAFWKFTGLRWSYDLQQNMDPDLLESYTRNKFVVYDRVQWVPLNPAGYQALTEAIVQKGRSALVHDRAAVSARPDDLRAGDQEAGVPVFLEENNPGLRVTHFDVNGVRMHTDFSQAKFLVYNDSYHQEWRVFLDGNIIPLYRANMAFKGVWVPPGQHLLEFRFGAPWRQVLSYGLCLAFALALGGLIFLAVRDARKI